MSLILCSLICIVPCLCPPKGPRESSSWAAVKLNPNSTQTQPKLNPNSYQELTLGLNSTQTQPKLYCSGVDFGFKLNPNCTFLRVDFGLKFNPNPLLHIAGMRAVNILAPPNAFRGAPYTTPFPTFPWAPCVESKQRPPGNMAPPALACARATGLAQER